MADAKDEKAEETKPAEDETGKETSTEEVKEDQPTVDQPKAEKSASADAGSDKKPEPSGKFKDLIKTIEGLTALELADLVKELEERFGVSAAAPVAAVSAAPTADGDAGAEEKSSYDVVLTEAGANKISAIKVVREITQLGLKEAKDLVEGAPKEIKKDVKKEEAEEMKKKIEEAGAKAELK